MNMVMRTDNSALVSGAHGKRETRTIRLLRNTNAGGAMRKAGDVVKVSRHEALMLMAIPNTAEPATEPKRGRPRAKSDA